MYEVECIKCGHKDMFPVEMNANKYVCKDCMLKQKFQEYYADLDFKESEEVWK